MWAMFTNIFEDSNNSYSMLPLEKKKQKIEYAKRRNNENHDEFIAYQKNYYQKNKEKLKILRKNKVEMMTDEERANRKVKFRMYTKRYMSNMTPEELQAYRSKQKLYRDTNKDKIKEKLRSKKENMTPQEIEQEKQKNRMKYLEKKGEKNMEIKDINTGDYYLCSCNKHVLKTNKMRHEKTKVHKLCLPVQEYIDNSSWKYQSELYYMCLCGKSVLKTNKIRHDKTTAHKSITEDVVNALLSLPNSE